MRTLLFTGTGGAGTSTLATAAALTSARSGRRTVLLSRQPPVVPGLDGVPGLTIIRTAPQPALERLWATHAPALSAAVPQLVLPPASSVLALPGIAELAALSELVRLATAHPVAAPPVADPSPPPAADPSSPPAADPSSADPSDVLLVLDAGPVEDGTALLALPGALRWWLRQLAPARLRVLGAVRAAAALGGGLRVAPADAALAAVAVVEPFLARVALTDPTRTAVHLVTTPQRSAVPAVTGAMTALAVHGQRPAALVVNRVLPVHGPGAWWARRAAEQEAVCRELAAVAPIRWVAEAAVAPCDVAELARLAVETVGMGTVGMGTVGMGTVGAEAVDAEPPAVRRPPAAAAPERVPGGWRLAVPLPFADRADVELTRSGDDLVVTAAGARRPWPLDSLLRRCVITGGVLADAGTAAARLEVSFAPDPQLWPADLLAAEGSRA